MRPCNGEQFPDIEKHANRVVNVALIGLLAWLIVACAVGFTVVHFVLKFW